MEIHIGKMIKSELDRQEHSIIWFCKRINRSRQNCYYIFNNPDIDISLLKSVCKALNHNFFYDISTIISEELNETSV